MNDGYNKEPVTIRKAIDHRNIAMGNTKVRPRRGVLCATFLQAEDNSAVVNLTLRNMKALSSFCRWALVVYRGSDADAAEVCKEAKAAAGKQLVYCNKSTHFDSSKAVAKSVLYRDLLPVLPDYERVMLVDDQISLLDFDYQNYMKIWDCGFFPNNAPLITQPVIDDSTQGAGRLWQPAPFIATGVGMVEHQVPFFDSIFFEWLVKYVLV